MCARLAVFLRRLLTNVRKVKESVIEGLRKLVNELTSDANMSKPVNSSPQYDEGTIDAKSQY